MSTHEVRDTDDGLAVKLGTTAVSMAAGWAAQKVVKLAWRRVTGSDAPSADDDDANLWAAVAFAAVGAGAGVVAQRWAHTRGKRLVLGLAHRRA